MRKKAFKTKESGKIGENLAASFLIKNNHKILQRNFYTRYGEIDLITIKDNCIYFYEVKFRKNYKYGFGEESITIEKINKIKASIEIWLLNNQFSNLTIENYYINSIIIDENKKIIEFEINN